MAQYEDRFYNSVDGLRLHYRDYAGPTDQPPILCLPGLTRNARDFEDVAARLAGEWRVLCLEFRGRGLSEKDPDPKRYMPKTYAADVLKLLDQLGIATAVFFGTSLGGLVTMLLAYTDEERIAGALINDVGPEVDPAGIERIRTYVGKPVNWRSWAEAEAAMGDRLREVYPNWGEGDLQTFLRRTCRQEADGSIVLDYDMAIALPFSEANEGTQPDLWPLLDGLKGKPVTLLRGELSDLLAQDVAERTVRTLGDQAELVTVPGVGHAPTLDEPEAVAAIDRLLARVRQREA
ncbi:alpha/beta fold hydrolase [Sphingomonas arenae]|uniref:alpha/beta fold hydrolase n=1 Tax=Sphingomonas arenae TaxID=2812555 RepID=UPI001967FB69